MWGTISFIMAPKRYNPDITAPAFEVRVDFPGSSQRETYELVTMPLEDVIHEIPGVDEIYSQSLQGGQSIVVVKFFVGEDMDSSKIRLRQQIDTNINLKPIGVTDITIAAIDPDNLPVMTLGLTSEKLDPVSLRKTAILLKHEIKHVKGTSVINVVGGRQREFRIILDPDRMRESKTSIQEIETILKERSLLRTLGDIKTDKKFIPIETSGIVRDIREIEELVIASDVDRSLKIKDVGTVAEEWREDDSYVDYYTTDESIEHAVFISIAKKKGANITRVTRAVNHFLDKLKEDPGQYRDIEISVLRDEGRVAYEHYPILVS
jgi:multidrug efflux pump subunit AcrB